MSILSGFFGSGDQTSITSTQTGAFQFNPVVNIGGDVTGQGQDANLDGSARTLQDGTPAEVSADLASFAGARPPSGIYGDVSDYGDASRAGFPVWALPVIALLGTGGVIFALRKGKIA